MRRTAQTISFVLLLLLGLPPVDVAANPKPASKVLSTSSSPYLRLHATDLVAWRMWGDEALQEAQATGRPILLSIGYMACHWCHVMREESFEDQATATIINDLFVPILLDREERPDVDTAFQLQAAHLGLPTGWPLTMFLMPDGTPFFGGTYYPPEPMGGMMSFKQLLNRVGDLYRSDPSGVAELAMTNARTFSDAYTLRPNEITTRHQDLAIEAIMSEVDHFHGGFGTAPKHPWWPAMAFLWRAHIETGREDIRDDVLNSLRAMLNGALYDHVAGGFYRYAEDPLWRVPHFEKMLDVNAGLVLVMTDVWRETRDAQLERHIHGTIEFLLSELRLSSGAFASSLDAVSIGPSGKDEEGAYYLWSEAELNAGLGVDAPAFFEAFGLAYLDESIDADATTRGVLYRRDMSAHPGQLDKLRDLQVHRAQPRRDEKILADGNGLAIRALAIAGHTLGVEKWVDAARVAIDASRRALIDKDARLRQSAFDGRQGPLATASGLAGMAEGALALFEVTGEKTYMDAAISWTEIALKYHVDTEIGGFFDSAADATAVPIRLKTFDDGPNPSANAQMIGVLARLYFLDGDARWRTHANKALQAVGIVAEEPSRHIAGLLNAAHLLQHALQVVIIGRRGDGPTDVLIDTLMSQSVPSQVLEIIAPGNDLPDGHPAKNKTQEDGLPTVYVCRGTFCSLPVTSKDDLVDTLQFMRKRT